MWYYRHSGPGSSADYRAARLLPFEREPLRAGAANLLFAVEFAVAVSVLDVATIGFGEGVGEMDDNGEIDLHALPQRFLVQRYGVAYAGAILDALVLRVPGIAVVLRDVEEYALDMVLLILPLRGRAATGRGASWIGAVPVARAP